MLKTVKRVFLGCCSILGISLMVWSIALLNPSMSYAHETQIENITVYHNQALEAEAEIIIRDALAIISKAEIYDAEIELDLCLNDGSLYPEYHPLSAALGYSFLNKAVLYDCTTNFKENLATAQWEVNNYELRKFNLTWLIAHEFTHCLQNNKDFGLQFKKGFWKLEGHAEYVAKEWKNDQSLKSKLAFYQAQEQLDLPGIPVLTMKDGTKEIFTYYKYALATQYLLDIEGLDFDSFIEDQRPLGEVYIALLNWNKNN